MRHFFIFCLLYLLSIPAYLYGQTCNNQAGFSFGVIADCQYCNCPPSGNSYWGNSITKLTEAVDHFNQMDISYAVHLGDFVQNQFSSYDSVVPIYQGLIAPHYFALGNHEFDGNASEDMQVLSKLGMSDYYYDFSYYNWRFIVMETTELAFYTESVHPELVSERDSIYNIYGGSTGSGGISQAQLAWIEETIIDAASKNQRVVLFGHHPLFPNTNANVWNDSEVISLLESYPNVVAYMNGHRHTGDYAVNNGIHYMTFMGMLLTADENAYSKIDVYKDRLDIIGYGREASRSLSINYANSIPQEINATVDNALTFKPIGSIIASLETADLDAADSHSYTIDQTYGQPDYFSIAGSDIILEKLVSHCAHTSPLSLKVTSTDCDGASIDTILTINIDVLAGLEDVSLEQAGLVINEIYYKPIDRTASDGVTMVDGCHLEFVELYNASQADIDITGLVLGGDVYAEASQSRILQAGEFFVFSSHALWYEEIYGCVPDAVFSGNLPDMSGRLCLSSATGGLYDQLQYSSFFPWSANAANGAYSLALIDPSVSNESSVNWTWQPQLFTPKETNEFSPSALPSYDGLVINEFHFADLSGDNRDFIEIYNSSNQLLFLTDVRITGSVDFNFNDLSPSVDLIVPHGYVVIADDLSAFQSAYGKSAQAEYNQALAKNGGDIIIQDLFGHVLDSVSYTDQDSWAAAYETGQSIALKSNLMDNSFHSSWSAQSDLNTACGLNLFDDCPDLIIEDDMPPIPSLLKKASLSIVTNGHIDNPDSTLYQAGECILLTQGFSVEIGAVFEAVINQCQ